jgi:uncharacterized protein YdaT
MPWTLDRPPAAMTHLPRPVLDKAIEIANALYAQGYDEGRCIRVAIAVARRWAGRRGDLAALPRE